MKGFLVVLILAVAVSSHATAPTGGDERLRELVVFPNVGFFFNLGISQRNNEWVIKQGETSTEDVAAQREVVNQHPDDLKQLMLLAGLLNECNETNEATRVYLKAEQICREEAAGNPSDGQSLLALGTVLAELDRQEEAESKFRSAVLVSSNDWRCWAGLGSFLGSRYRSTMFLTNLANEIILSFNVPSEKVLAFHPSPEALEKTEAAVREASHCYERAIKIAPGDPEVYVQYAGFLMFSNWANCLIGHYRNGQEVNAQIWTKAAFSPPMIASLQKASDLKSNDCEYIGVSAFFKLLGAGADNLSDMQPDTIQQMIKPALIRLNTLANNPDKTIAISALENLELLSVMQKNYGEAEADARRVLALDPTRSMSWDILLCTMLESSSETKEDIVATCEARLKVESTVRAHLMLSKALTKLEKWKEAGIQAQIATGLDQTNILPPLMAAAIALKSSNPDFLNIACTNLMRVQTLLTQDAKPEDWHAGTLDTAIYLLLANQPDQAAEYAKALLKSDSSDAAAAEILRRASQK